MRITNFRPSHIASTAMMLLVMASTVNAQVGVVDLTQEKPKDAGILGLPGIESGGFQTAAFPVEVRIEEMWPATLEVGDRLYVTLLIRNVGKDTVAIPTSKHYRRVLEAGNTGKQIMDVQVVLTPKGDGVREEDAVAEVLGVATGSDTVSGSIVLLEPGASIRIKSAGVLWEARRKWFGDRGTGIITFEAKCTVVKEYLRDDKYVLWKITEKAQSTNTVVLTLGPARQ